MALIWSGYRDLGILNVRIKMQTSDNTAALYQLAYLVTQRVLFAFTATMKN